MQTVAGVGGGGKKNRFFTSTIILRIGEFKVYLVQKPIKHGNV